MRGVDTTLSKFQGSNLHIQSGTRFTNGTSFTAYSRILQNGNGMEFLNNSWASAQYIHLGSTYHLCGIGRKKSSTTLQYYTGNYHQWDIGIYAYTGTVAGI